MKKNWIHLSQAFFRNQKNVGLSIIQAKIAQVRQEGKRSIKREIEHYNLDLIISVGYSVNSKRGTQFRVWANDEAGLTALSIILPWCNEATLLCAGKILLLDTLQNPIALIQ